MTKIKKLKQKIDALVDRIEEVNKKYPCSTGQRSLELGNVAEVLTPLLLTVALAAEELLEERGAGCADMPAYGGREREQAMRRALGGVERFIDGEGSRLWSSPCFLTE